MKKLLAVLLTAAMLFSLVVMIGAETSPVKAYVDAEAGELLYTVDFEGDSAFTPEARNAFANDFSAEVGDDGASVTFKGIKEDIPEGFQGSYGYWGGKIEGLRADANTHYTMIYKVKANTEDVKNNSVGIGGVAVNEVLGNGKVYNNYSNHGGAIESEDRAAISLGSEKLIAKPNEYVHFSAIDAYDVDDDGFVTMMNDYNGKTFTTYILKDGEIAVLNTENWIELQSTQMNLLAKNGICFEAYCWYQAVDTTVKDVEIYKGLTATTEYDPLNTEPPVISEGANDLRDKIMDAGYGLEVKYNKADVPEIDGFFDEGEWDHVHADMFGAAAGNESESLLPKGYAGALGDAQSLKYAVEHDKDYIYVAAMFNNGNGADRGLYITINAVERGEGKNTPKDLQAVFTMVDAKDAEGNDIKVADFGRLVFGPAKKHISGNGIPAQVFIDFDGTVYENQTDTEPNKYYEVAVGISDDGTTSIHEFKISKAFILEKVNAQYPELKLTNLNYFDLTLTIDNYSHFANWGHVGATVEGAGLDANGIGMTFDDGTPIDRFGMPVYLTDGADPNPPVEEPEEPSEDEPTGDEPAGDEPAGDEPAGNDTPAATTTVAEATTTAAPTEATTAAEEKKGCKGSISLAALAIVPVLACGAAFVGKRKED